ncbi:hypothetical protein J7E62_24605 [Variovorax paradoxus]|nr:hypothetical protein [Variovorax paradoxus]
MRTIRVSVREDVIERQTIEVEVEDDFELDDTEALQEALEEVFVTGAYRVVPNTNDVSVEGRVFFDPEEITE